MAKMTLTFKQKMELVEKMRSVIVADGDGMCHYVGDKNDDIVAKELGATPSIIRGIRQEMFGMLRVRIPASSVSMKADVEAIIEYLTRKDPNWRLR